VLDFDIMDNIELVFGEDDSEEEFGVITPDLAAEAFLALDGVHFMFYHKNGDRVYLRAVYNDPANRLLLMTSRQAEKSTTIGNKLLLECVTIPHSKSLYVIPRMMQVGEFSKKKITPVVEFAQMLPNNVWKYMINNKLENRVVSKMFANGSMLDLRAAFLNAENIRGISVNGVLAFDEYQSFVKSLIPIIMECASHYPESAKYIWCGTPTTFENQLYVDYMKSTSNEWCIKCDHCGNWNEGLSADNLGLTSVICRKCGGDLTKHNILYRGE